MTLTRTKPYSVFFYLKDNSNSYGNVHTLFSIYKANSHKQAAIKAANKLLSLRGLNQDWMIQVDYLSSDSSVSRLFFLKSHHLKGSDICTQDQHSF